MGRVARILAVGALGLCACLKQSGPTARTPAAAARDERKASGPAMDDPGPDGDGDFVVGPEYSKSPDLTDRGAPRGHRFDFTMASSDSKIFRGEDTTLKPEHQHPFTRKIAVYVPARYKDGTAAPILIIHDGPGHIERVSFALDNLTISNDPKRRLPPFIAIAVANGGSDSKGSERGLEYDTMSDRLARFINDEVLPAVLANGHEIDDPDTRRWLEFATVANQPYLVPAPDAPYRLPADHSYEPSADLYEDVQRVHAAMAGQGMEVLVLDQTRPDVGMPVVKVVVPGMRHFWARFGPGRLYDVPVRLGRLTEPTPYEQLNPYPLFM